MCCPEPPREAHRVRTHLRSEGHNVGFRLSVRRGRAGGNHAQWRSPPISVALRAFCPTLGRVRGNELVRRIQALGEERGVEVR